jgi:hypothetical protein
VNVSLETNPAQPLPVPNTFLKMTFSMISFEMLSALTLAVLEEVARLLLVLVGLPTLGKTARALLLHMLEHASRK